MDVDRLHECLNLLADCLGFAAQGIGKSAMLEILLGVNERFATRLLSGRTEVPPRISAWFEALCRFYSYNPPPEGVPLTMLLLADVVGGHYALEMRAREWLAEVRKFHAEHPPPPPPRL